MDYLLEKVAYLKGLMDGLEIDDRTNEGKILVNIVDILHDIVHEIDDLNASKDELDEYIQTIDEDLSDVENELYGDDDDDEYTDDSHYIEVECPHCHETVYFADDLFDTDNELYCPNCNESIYDEELSDLDD